MKVCGMFMNLQVNFAQSSLASLLNDAVDILTFLTFSSCKTFHYIVSLLKQTEGFSTSGHFHFGSRAYTSSQCLHIDC